MDKKNLTIGLLFAAGAIACMIYTSRQTPVQPNPAAVHAAAAPSSAALSTTGSSTAEAAMPTEAQPTEFAATVSDHPDAEVAHLENSFIEADFTNYGGALRTVALQKYPAALKGPQPFVMNELHKDPMVAFVQLPGLDQKTAYKLISHTDNQVVYQTIWNHQLEVTRTYTLSPDAVGKTDPYEIRLATTFRNLTGASVTVPVLQLALGTAAPVATNDRGTQLASGYSSNGKQSFITRGQLEASGGLLGLVGSHPATPEIQNPGPMQWTSVANQFFVSILTPDQPAAGLVTRRVRLLGQLPDTDPNAYGITADAVFNLPPLAPHASSTLGADLYCGPKEYHRLANAEVFHEDQDRVMNFGMFRFFSALLLTLLTWMYHVVPNWGVAIILTTLLLKVIFLPFTLAASRSAKRMQKLQPQMKEIKEKYKDNAQKQQMATMELFKANKVNPVGGCVPMLITLPFFWGFFRMLYSAAELRFAHFLWAPDLSQPDTVGHLFGVPINVLPLLLGITMFLQMQFTPQPSVSADNSQAAMMKFMPLMFMFFCYTYSCALSLYSTVNAVFSIVQQMVINRMKDPDPVVATPGGKTLKNVTPRRR